MSSFFLAIFAAICWGLAPIFGKIGLQGVKTFDGLASRTLITVLLVVGWLIGTDSHKRIITFSRRTWFFLAIEAFLATFAGDLAYYAAIKKGDIGQTALILAGSPLITIAVGCLFLHEKLTPTKTFGAILVIIGVALVGLSPNT